jgi:hypothetical protein
MSKSFPRVSPLTRPRQPKVLHLPPLQLAVLHNGELSHVMNIPDPREAVMRQLCQRGDKHGITAYAITDEAEVVKPVRKARKAGAK